MPKLSIFTGTIQELLNHCLITNTNKIVKTISTKKKRKKNKHSHLTVEYVQEKYNIKNREEAEKKLFDLMMVHMDILLEKLTLSGEIDPNRINPSENY
jgi:Trm5-related predicted tRNA methylase